MMSSLEKRGRKYQVKAVGEVKIDVDAIKNFAAEIWFGSPLSLRYWYLKNGEIVAEVRCFSKKVTIPCYRCCDVNLNIFILKKGFGAVRPFFGFKTIFHVKVFT